VFIYANGYNELAPEISSAVAALSQVAFSAL
jgi:hypothetical protein